MEDKKVEIRLVKPPKWRVWLHYGLITLFNLLMIALIIIVLKNIEILSGNPCQACENLTGCQVYCWRP